MRWYYHACPVCGSDLHDDLEDRGWVTCFSCATSFKNDDPRVVDRIKEKVESNEEPDAEGKEFQ